MDPRTSGSSAGLAESANLAKAANSADQTEMANALSDQSIIVDSITKGLSILGSKLEGVLAHDEEKALAERDTEESRFMSLRARQIDTQTNRLRAADQLIHYLIRTAQV